MFCTHCGAQARQGTSFCSSCGNALTAPVAVQASAEPYGDQDYRDRNHREQGWAQRSPLFSAPPAPAVRPVGRERTALFAHTMSLVAIAVGFSAAGMYLGRNLDPTHALLYWLGGLVLTFGLGAAARRSQQLAMGVLFALATALGVAVGPTVAAYAHYDPSALWQSGVATALMVAALGSVGYTMRRDLAPYARLGFFAILGLIGVGLVIILAGMPQALLVYSILGLVVFSGVIVLDFNRLSHRASYDNAPLIAAGIFLDILNVFLFFLRIFGGGRR